MPIDNPMVACVMLVNGREAMVRRAVRAFESQTYERRALYIWDTTPGRGIVLILEPGPRVYYPDVDKGHFRGQSIGVLRNAANKYALAHYQESWTRPDVLMHWDSDDWSHPYRIEEQVQLLVASGKECVGYNSLLFWQQATGAAWLYSNVRHDYAVGTSLCYWADVWSRHPFPDLPKRAGGTGEDTEWIRALRVGAHSSLPVEPRPVREHPGSVARRPRMIASIHGANTQLYAADMMNPPNWQRVPEWDRHCAEVMQL